jgi:hypothetical protein
MISSKDYHQQVELNVIRETLPGLTDHELSDIRDRFAAGALSDHHQRVCASIAREYRRRGYRGRFVE